ncbi:hypothetical protein ACIB24_01070 [Spongisporangium articulatum]|uniref:Ion channel n=1 Tax=Spongisporangium articulatum TaxID=3362603 RepID=A0ABW8AHL7_9ACTN
MKRMKWHWSELKAVLRAKTPTHQMLRERLTSLAVATLVLDGLLTLGVWVSEAGAKGSQIYGFWDALWWTTCQMLTVSSNLAAPVTAFGRVLDVVAELWAITVVATLTGSIGGFLHRRGMERHPMADPR